MPLIFLAVRSVRFVKLVKNPIFQQVLTRQAQTGIMKIALKEAVGGVAKRAGALFVLGLLVDPFNRFVVPHSKGLLITTGEAAGNITSFDTSDPLRTFATVTLATPEVLIDIGIDITQAIVKGTAMVVVSAVGELKSAAEFILPG